MKVRVTLDGLSLFVTPKEKPQPEPKDSVTILLPNAMVTPVHLDDTPAHSHQPYMLVPESQVKSASTTLQKVQMLGRGPSRPERSYFAVPLVNADVVLKGKFVTSEDRPIEKENWDRDMTRLVNFADWPADLALEGEVLDLARAQTIPANHPAADRVIARVRLTGGLPEIQSDPGLQWIFPDDLGTDKTPRDVAIEADYVLDVDGAATVEWTHYGAAAVQSIELRDDGQEVLIWIGNNCLHPALWQYQDGEGAIECEATRTYQMMKSGFNPKTDATPDLDFKWYYRLLKSTSGKSILERLGTNELPVPAAKRVATKALEKSVNEIMDAGSPTCGKARVTY